METNEWKTAWQALDERLKKQELLEARTIREMLYTKSGRSLNKLLNFEFLSLIIFILVIPFMGWLLHTVAKTHYTKATLLELKPLLIGFFIFMLFFCLAYLPWIIYKVQKLMKIDFTGSISENHRIINLYDLWIKRERFGSYIGIPPLFAIGIYVYAKLQASMGWWAYLVGVYAFCLFFIYYYYKKVYYPSINTIRKSLDELKELDEKES